MKNYSDFIAGKKYKYTNLKDVIVTCLGHRSDGMPIFEGGDKAVFPLSFCSSDLSQWVEYREPQEVYLVRFADNSWSTRTFLTEDEAIGYAKPHFIDGVRKFREVI